MSHTSFTRRHRRDATHSEVVEMLKAFGFSVIDLSTVGGGVSDLLVGWWGVTDMIEVKSTAEATYTPAQIELRKRWRGSPIVRIESAKQAEEWARRTRHARSRASIPPLPPLPPKESLR
jgi:hypothetical protein